MRSRWPIRNKLLVGIGLLLVIVATLSWSGFYGVYSYRGLVRGLSDRADELPVTAALSAHVVQLRLTVAEARGAILASSGTASVDESSARARQTRFAAELDQVRRTLRDYRMYLNNNQLQDSVINDSRDEWATVAKIETALKRVDAVTASGLWATSQSQLGAVEQALDGLQDLVRELPEFLHRRIHGYKGDVRHQYRGLIILTWITTVSGAVMMCVFVRLFYTWIFRPLRILVQGSRRVAAGEFRYRIKLDTQDEMSELADSMNNMTARFEAIRDDLDRQVRERTKQVVRSEQLASVGFLAAGVAHEINNPLASIALCAESLEGRVQELLDALPAPSADGAVIRNYLRMIQDEAFRCKGITERLLDFSRIGDVTRQSTDMRELVQSVIDMVSHLGRYQDKHIELVPGDSPIASVNSQELKQVVLNMVTNALDSLSAGGLLRIELRRQGSQVALVFTDNGCGMTEEVLKHLFEPFFTRRRDGQGTGLGLSITYRIVADHGGHIDVHSDGPGRGAQFHVWLPLAEQQKERDHRYQAA